MKYVFDISSVTYPECLFPLAFQLRELGMNSSFGKYLSGQTCLPHCSHCLSLFIQLKSCTCLLSTNPKVSEAVKMGRKIVLGRERVHQILTSCITKVLS